MASSPSASISPSASVSPSPSAAFEPTQTNVTAVAKEDNVIITEPPAVEITVID